MFGKVLIANRGEIAVRIIQTCNEMNIKTVAVYSEADQDALHVKLANESFCIGPSPLKQSYLNMKAILKAAISTQADAIHPGYGFLTESDEFAALCERFNISFIGPSVSAIQKTSINDLAKQTVKDVGIPISPGSEGVVKTSNEAIKVATQIGFPVILKGTGIKDTRIQTAYDETELKAKFNMFQKEAPLTFINVGIRIEKYIEKCRHIEVQILADTNGHTIHLGERDCSIQKHDNTVLEEAPAPTINQQVRRQMREAAVTVAKAFNYSGVGTVEFLYDAQYETFYFIKMHSGLQAEYPITEMVTGIDLIKQQLELAAGKDLKLTQDAIPLSGCSIECHINAHDLAQNCRPSHGKVRQFITPGGMGVRVDSAMYVGCSVKHYYDSSIAKLIVRGDNRKDAIDKMTRALHHFFIDGIHTTIPFFIALLENKTFLEGHYDTNFLDSFV